MLETKIQISDKRESILTEGLKAVENQYRLDKSESAKNRKRDENLNINTFATAIKRLGFEVFKDRSYVSTSKYVFFDVNDDIKITFRQSDHELPQRHYDNFGYEEGNDFFDVGNTAFANFLTWKQALDFVLKKVNSKQ